MALARLIAGLFFIRLHRIRTRTDIAVRGPGVYGNAPCSPCSPIGAAIDESATRPRDALVHGCAAFPAEPGHGDRHWPAALASAQSQPHPLRGEYRTLLRGSEPRVAATTAPRQPDRDRSYLCRGGLVLAALPAAGAAAGARGARPRACRSGPTRGAGHHLRHPAYRRMGTRGLVCRQLRTANGAVSATADRGAGPGDSPRPGTPRLNPRTDRWQRCPCTPPRPAQR